MRHTTITRGGGHVAVLDVLRGVGVLVCPLPDTNVFMASAVSRSLHEADWDALIGELYRHGWEPVGDEWDCPVEAGRLPDGRRAIMLGGPDHDDWLSDTLASLMGCMDEAAAA